MPIALLTNKTFLMRKTGDNKWEKLIDITKYPQLFGEADTHEVTRLSDSRKRYIKGLEDANSLGFEANYTNENRAKLEEVKASGAMDTYRLCFGDEVGTDGCFEWSGYLSYYVQEGEANGVRKLSFTISDEGDEALKEVKPEAAQANQTN